MWLGKTKGMLTGISRLPQRIRGMNRSSCVRTSCVHMMPFESPNISDCQAEEPECTMQSHIRWWGGAKTRAYVVPKDAFSWVMPQSPRAEEPISSSQTGVLDRSIGIKRSLGFKPLNHQEQRRTAFISHSLALRGIRAYGGH